MRYFKDLKTGDYIILALAAGFLGAVWYQLAFEINYDWDWSGIPSFFVYHDPETGYQQNVLLIGFFNLIRIAVYSAILSIILGMGLALMRVSERRWMNWTARLIVEFVRNIPPLVFLFIFYFFVSDMIFPVLGIRSFAQWLGQSDSAVVGFFFGDRIFIENLIAGVICLSLFEAAYVSEIFRAGIESVGRDQREGARSVGVTRFQEMRYIVLPQALQKTVPPLVGQLITLIKDTSIMSVISIQEFTFAGSEMVVSSGRIFEVWITVAIVYFIICYALSAYSRRLEITQQGRKT
ncbi:amino acid ABC transporter permease [Primorskyibacter sp. S187A]|uniref:amino acid ABC transporter permease n=1 Tax=Primorskyibacter sp. S187A TaxID=3415130 RepID=UPI003C7A2063